MLYDEQAAKMHDFVDEVQEDHIKRLDVPVDDLIPRPRRKRRPAKTALLSIEAKKAYCKRILTESLLFSEF